MSMSVPIFHRRIFAMTTDADFLDWLGTKYRVILPSASTNGSMSITHSISPGGSGPPRHVHQREDETFYIRSGRCDFWVNGEIFSKMPGETMFVARGTSHTFRVPGHEPCDHLTIMTPGGFEGFFAEMAAGEFRVPQDMAQIDEAAGRYSMSFTGPPLSEADIQR
jgi:mannose-6-phosphate isomerase-like protein (cupin superfamily)